LNTTAIYFAAGYTFFIGMALATVSGIPALYLRGRLVKGVLRVLAITGALLVVLSGTPLPVYAYGLWLGALVLTLMLSGAEGTTPRIRRAKVVMAAALVTASVALCLVESAYWATPRVDVPLGRPVYVIGDSISAGMGGREKPWPEVLSRSSGLAVVNLAEPGATVQSALAQAAKVEDGRALVLIEIGGNDLLSRMGSAEFGLRLDQLLTMLHDRGNPLAMVELPLPPFCNGFGSVQRQLAAKHNVTLIPKRYLAGVLAQEGATLDGLHLSQAGHDRLAHLVAAMLYASQGAGTRNSVTSP
jgi:acyl-CoA thioesterase-1